jgi:hypothetical protein
MANSYLVKAKCARGETCPVRRAEDRTVPEYRTYEGEVEAHQLALVPLYAHTAHGGCGLHCTLDGESILK